MKVYLQTPLFLLILSVSAFAEPSVPKKLDEVQESLKKLNPACVSCADSKGEKIKPKTISDSLVKDLDCSTLTYENVFRNLQPDAFGNSRSIPIENNRSEFNGGACWALTLSQQRYYYLTRFNEKESLELNDWSESEWSQFLKIYSHTKKCVQNGRGPLTCHFALKEKTADDFAIVKTGSPKYDSSRIRNDLSNMSIGLIAKSDADLEGSIANYPRLVKWYVFPTNQEKILNQINKYISQGRSVAVRLRGNNFDFAGNHEVLVKPGDTAASLFVYDSNSPQWSSPLTYVNGVFYYENAPVIVDLDSQDEMDVLQEVNYRYYKKKCEELGK